jgi:hypothetical protein
MKRLRTILLMLFVGAVVLSACAPAAQQANATDPNFPTYVYDSALSLRAYRIAVRMPEMLDKLPCYCDCGRASGHQSLRDCFFKREGGFNDHASGCEVCGLEAVDAAQWQSEGKTLKHIRAMIDAKYAAYGTATNTPPVE